MLYTQILNEITCQYHMPENGRPNSAANSPAGARKFRCRPTRQDRPKWLISNISGRRGSDFRGSRPVFSLLAGKADSAAREGVDLGPARRRLVGDPALTAVEARIDLAAVGGARHTLRLALVEGEREHRMRRLEPHLDPAPAVAAVAAVQQHADLALEAAARRHPQLARSARHRADVAAVDLPLGVERLQRHVPPVVAAVGAGEHAGPADAEDGARPPAADQDRVHVDGVVVQVLAVAQILPMLAAVGRADGAADLDRTVEQLALAGAGVEPQHALGRVGTRCRRDLREADRDGQARPVFAGVVAAVDLAILAADEDYVGVVRMEQDRPDRQAVVGELDLLPVLAAVGAAIGTGLRAGIKDLGPFR